MLDIIIAAVSECFLVLQNAAICMFAAATSRTIATSCSLGKHECQPGVAGVAMRVAVAADVDAGAGVVGAEPEGVLERQALGQEMLLGPTKPKRWLQKMISRRGRQWNY